MDTHAFGRLCVQASRRAGRLSAWIGAALVALALTAAPALAQTALFVNGSTGTNSGPNNCHTQGSPCLTIGYAVTQAASGDTLNIAAGTYDEAVSTSLTNLSFVGAGAGTGGTLIDSTVPGGSALSLTGTGDSVSDLALQTNDPGVGGALNVSGSATVTATGVTIATGANPVSSTQNGSDGIDFSGASLTVSDSTISVTNTDMAIQDTASSSVVVQDGSGIEDNSGGALTVTGTTIQTVRGMALRIRAGTTSTTVRDSLLASSGVEDYTTNETDYEFDQWPVIEAGSGTVGLHDSSVYNATVGVIDAQPTVVPTNPPTEYGPRTDALWAPDTSGGGFTPATVTLDNTILQTQPTANSDEYGTDIDTGVPVTATDSAYTTVATNDTGSAPSPGTAGIIAGDPGLNNPGGGDFTLAPGSALLGDGDTSDDQPSEMDLGRNPRTTACTGAVTSITNIGAFETAVPPCPAALSTGDSTGALTQLTGANNCITGDSNAHSGCGSASEPGMTGGVVPPWQASAAYDSAPTDTVQSLDGKNVYVATEDPADNGVDIAELARASDGSLTELTGANDCVEPTSGTGGCGTTDAALLYSVAFSHPVFEPARMAISPDGENLYVDDGADIAEFSRDPSTGVLTPLAASDCIDFTDADPSCSSQDQEQVASAAAMAVSPNGDHLYLATLNQCSFASDPPGPPGDNQNPDCNNDPPDGYFASSDIAVLARDPTTGVLTPGPCYDNATTPQQGCDATDSDGNAFVGLYWMTSMAISSDGDYLYVTSQVGASQGSPASDPFGVLSRDPGEISELSVNPSTGALRQITGSGACVTAGSGCGAAGDAGQSEVPGVADPQQIVLSPDGLNAYVTGAQYTILGGASAGDNVGYNGLQIGATLAQLQRDPNTGILTPISGATCYAGYHEACGTANGPGSNVTQVPGLTGAEALAVSPDGKNVYATAQNIGVNSAVVEFSRDTDTGLLTPLSTPNLCLSNGSAPGASSPYACGGGSGSPTGLSDSVAPLPGGVLVSPDCQSALVMSDGLAEFSRSSPGGNCLSSLGFSEPSLAFNTAPHSTSGSQTVTVTNEGPGSLTFGAGALALGGTDPGDFTLTGDTCSGQTIALAGTCTFSVDFTAPGAGMFGADVLLSDNAPGSPQSYELHGTGGVAAASFSPPSLTFGSPSDRVAVGSPKGQIETITNTGSASLVLGTLSLSGAQQSSFTLGTDGCSGQTLLANASCNVTIKYSPSQAGSDSAQLDVPDNAAGSPQNVGLSGFAGTPSVGFAPASLSFFNGSTLTVAVQDTSADTQLTVTGVSITGTDAGHFTEQDNCAATVTPGGSCGIDVTFNSGTDGSFHAQLLVSDNGSGSPQTVELTGVEAPSVSGTVYDDSQAPAAPLAGATIAACPQNGSGTKGDCSTVVSAADGSYGLRLPPGSWLLQLTPPQSSPLFGGQAVIRVVAGQSVVQDFDLTPPTPLSDGMSVNGQTSGVPVVTWTQPFNVAVPLHLPASGPPSSTEIYVYVTGMTAAGGGSGFDLAMLTMFGVYYDSSGAPVAFGPTFSTQLDCRGTPSPCAGPLSMNVPGAGAATGTGAAVDDHRSRRPTDPIAHAAGCPPTTVDMSIMPGQLNAVPTANGVHWVADFSFGSANPGPQWDLGTTNIYQPPQVTPFPADPNYPLLSQSIQIGASMINSTLAAPSAVYNNWVTNTQTLSTAQRVNNPSVAAQLNQNATINMAVQTLDGAYHGDSQFVQQGLKFLDKQNSVNMQTNAATLQGVLDCPPQSSSGRVDPSGTVTTTTGIPVAGAKVVLTRSSKARGKQKPVPNGSTIMSPSNRRNPDHTSALGVFHWDVFPGYYQVRASHPNCLALKGDSAFGLTPVLAVPPPRFGLAIKLRCKDYKRTTTKLKLRLVTHGKAGGLILAAVTYVHGRAVPPADLPGEVTFKIPGVISLTKPIQASHGRAFYDLPLTKRKIKLVTATFLGNGYLAPSRAKLKNP